MELKSVTKENFDLYYSFLEKDFCLEERRTKEDEFKALGIKRFKPFLIYYENEVVGCCSCWEFEDFIFGEHYLILKERRTNLLGLRFFRNVLNSMNKLFVFEIEQPIEAIARKRKLFYERLNVSDNDFKYNQPSYHNDGKEIPMLFLSYPKKLSEAEFKKITKQIRKTVYGIN